jgi:hypothetical protein
MTTQYEDRCCGRFSDGPIGVRNPATTCTHNFYLVRVDQITGETSFVPHLSGPVSLSRLDVKRHEWQRGSFTVQGLPEWSLGRLLARLDIGELEWLRDEFLAVGEDHPQYPKKAHLDAFNVADQIQDVLELLQHGRIVTERTE